MGYSMVSVLYNTLQWDTALASALYSAAQWRTVKVKYDCTVAYSGVQCCSLEMYCGVHFQIPTNFLFNLTEKNDDDNSNTLIVLN